MLPDWGLIMKMTNSATINQNYSCSIDYQVRNSFFNNMLSHTYFGMVSSGEMRAVSLQNCASASWAVGRFQCPLTLDMTKVTMENF